jgi:hypothetical protein
VGVTEASIGDQSAVRSVRHDQGVVQRRCTVTQTLERPRTEVDSRPPVLPEYDQPTLIRWIPWLHGLLMVAVAVVALWMSVPVDDSYERSENIRFEQIAANRYPIDNSLERAEFIHFENLR